MTHDQDCKCLSCEKGPEYAREQEEKWMREMGWYAHLVENNYHTHGFDQTFNHPDIQIVVPLDPKLLHNLANCVIDRIKAGNTIVPNERTPGIIKGLDVLFIETTEGDRPVLRMILPDPQGNVERDKIEPPWDTQYTE